MLRILALALGVLALSLAGAAPARAAAVGAGSVVMGGHERVCLEASLCGQGTSMRGHAKFDGKFDKGKCDQKLKIEVEHGCPNTCFDVLINGEHFAFLRTDKKGKGKLDLKWKGKHCNKCLPHLEDGDTITIGPIEGTFHNCHCD
jgi:hypothetical protein